MAKRKKKEHDFAVNAFRVVQEASKETDEGELKAKQPLDKQNKHDLRDRPSLKGKLR